MEQRIDGCLRTRERGGVRAGGTCAGCRATGLHRNDRFRTSHAASDAAELAWISEGFEVEQNDIRIRVVFPVLEQVVRRHVGLVADRHEGRETQAPLGRSLQDCKAERTTLRREADVARRKSLWAEGGVEAWPRDRDAKAVRDREGGPRLRAPTRPTDPVALFLPVPSPRSPRRSRKAHARLNGVLPRRLRARRPLVGTRRRDRPARRFRPSTGTPEPRQPPRPTGLPDTRLRRTPREGYCERAHHRPNPCVRDAPITATPAGEKNG